MGNFSQVSSPVKKDADCNIAESSCQNADCEQCDDRDSNFPRRSQVEAMLGKRSVIHSGSFEIVLLRTPLTLNVG